MDKRSFQLASLRFKNAKLGICRKAWGNVWKYIFNCYQHDHCTGTDHRNAWHFQVVMWCMLLAWLREKDEVSIGLFVWFGFFWKGCIRCAYFERQCLLYDCFANREQPVQKGPTPLPFCVSVVVVLQLVIIGKIFFFFARLLTKLGSYSGHNWHKLQITLHKTESVV